MPDYTPQSNRECGNGRPDIALVPYDEEAPVILMELKVCKRFTEMEQGCRAALDQIKEKDYAAPFLDKGFVKIIKYGICFCEKTCMVKTMIG